MRNSCFIIVVAFGFFSFLSSCTTTQKLPESRPVSQIKKLDTTKKSSVTVSNSSSRAEKHAESKQLAILKKKYASLMNTDSELLQNGTLLRFIDQWYGTPYKYGGKDRSGIDCSSFTSTLLKNVYDISFDGTSATMFSKCERVKKDELKEGDLVFFKIHRGRISHVGVYVFNDYFIHSSTKAGVGLSSLAEPYYKKYFAGAGRIRTSNRDLKE